MVALPHSYVTRCHFYCQASLPPFLRDALFKWPILLKVKVNFVWGSSFQVYLQAFLVACQRAAILQRTCSSILVALQPVDCKPVALVKRELLEISRRATNDNTYTTNVNTNTNAPDRVFNRVAECRNFSCYFTKNRFYHKWFPKDLIKPLNSHSKHLCWCQFSV